MRTLIDELLEMETAPTVHSCRCKHSANKGQHLGAFQLWASQDGEVGNSGQERAAVQAAIAAGNRNENRLSDLIFFRRHPERNGRLIQRNEPNFSALSQEWLRIRDQIVRPELAKSTSRPKRRTIYSLTCKDNELLDVQQILGKPVTYDELHDEISKRAAMAASLCIKAATFLEKNPRSQRTRDIFKKIFRVRPEYAADWLKKLGWNSRGALTAFRLRLIAKMLTDGTIKYFCKGDRGYCPECTDAWTEYVACSSWGKRRVICLGKPFWEQWEAGNIWANINTLMHEALHIYFGLLIAHGEEGKGKFSDANCYSHFVLATNGKSVPWWVSQRCSQTAVR